MGKPRGSYGEPGPLIFDEFRLGGDPARWAAVKAMIDGELDDTEITMVFSNCELKAPAATVKAWLELAMSRGEPGG